MPLMFFPRERDPRSGEARFHDDECRSPLFSSAALAFPSSLYLRNRVFHASVYQLAPLEPAWVDLVVEELAKQNACHNPRGEGRQLRRRRRRRGAGGEEEKGFVAPEADFQPTKTEAVRAPARCPCWGEATTMPAPWQVGRLPTTPTKDSLCGAMSGSFFLPCATPDAVLALRLLLSLHPSPHHPYIRRGAAGGSYVCAACPSAAAPSLLLALPAGNTGGRAAMGRGGVYLRTHRRNGALASATERDARQQWMSMLQRHRQSCRSFVHRFSESEGWRGEVGGLTGQTRDFMTTSPTTVSLRARQRLAAETSAYYRDTLFLSSGGSASEAAAFQLAARSYSGGGILGGGEGRRWSMYWWHRSREASTLSHEEEGEGRCRGRATAVEDAVGVVMRWSVAPRSLFVFMARPPPRWWRQQRDRDALRGASSTTRRRSLLAPPPPVTGEVQGGHRPPLPSLAFPEARPFGAALAYPEALVPAEPRRSSRLCGRAEVAVVVEQQQPMLLKRKRMMSGTGISDGALQEAEEMEEAEPEAQRLTPPTTSPTREGPPVRQLLPSMSEVVLGEEGQERAETRKRLRSPSGEGRRSESKWPRLDGREKGNGGVAPPALPKRDSDELTEHQRFLLSAWGGAALWEGDDGPAAAGLLAFVLWPRLFPCPGLPYRPDPRLPHRQKVRHERHAKWRDSCMATLLSADSGRGSGAGATDAVPICLLAPDAPPMARESPPNRGSLLPSVAALFCYRVHAFGSSRSDTARSGGSSGNEDNPIVLATLRNFAARWLSQREDSRLWLARMSLARRRRREASSRDGSVSSDRPGGRDEEKEELDAAKAAALGHRLLERRMQCEAHVRRRRHQQHCLRNLLPLPLPMRSAGAVTDARLAALMMQRPGCAASDAVVAAGVHSAAVCQHLLDEDAERAGEGDEEERGAVAQYDFFFFKACACVQSQWEVATRRLLRAASESVAVLSARPDAEECLRRLVADGERREGILIFHTWYYDLVDANAEARDGHGSTDEEGWRPSECAKASNEELWCVASDDTTFHLPSSVVASTERMLHGSALSSPPSDIATTAAGACCALRVLAADVLADPFHVLRRRKTSREVLPFSQRYDSSVAALLAATERAAAEAAVANVMALRQRCRRHPLARPQRGSHSAPSFLPPCQQSREWGSARRRSPAITHERDLERVLSALPSPYGGGGGAGRAGGVNHAITTYAAYVCAARRQEDGLASQLRGLTGGGFL